MERSLCGSSTVSNGDMPLVVATQVMDVADAIYHTARSYEGGARALSRRMQTRDKLSGDLVPMNENTFTHKVNPNCHTHNVTVEEARDMMVLSGDYRVLHALAADTGHVAIRLHAGANVPTMERVAALAKEFSDVLAVVTEAQASSGDGGSRITRNEMGRIEREASELIGALNALVGGLRAQMEVRE